MNPEEKRSHGAGVNLPYAEKPFSRGFVSAMRWSMNSENLIERMQRTQQKAAETAKRRFVKNQQDRQQRAIDKANKLAEELRDAGFESGPANLGA